MALLANTHRTYLLVGPHRATLMSYAGRLSTFSAFQHHVRDMDRHRFLDDAALPRLALRTHMLLYNIQAFNNHLASLWQCPRNSPFLPTILAGEYQDGVTLLDIHFIGK